MLADQTLAFDGTVQAITDGSVTLAPTQCYAGEPTDAGRGRRRPARRSQALIGACEFEDGGRYLVSATDGQVTVCGFSAPYSAELAALYDQAFTAGRRRATPLRRLWPVTPPRSPARRRGRHPDGPPKALVRDDAGSRGWCAASRPARRRLRRASPWCSGAAAEEAARAARRASTSTSWSPTDWAEGMSASLRAGLASLAGRRRGRGLVSLVDLPDVTADVVRRVAGEPAPDRASLARASYDGGPGHPVADRPRPLGRRRSRPPTGDRGARDYLGHPRRAPRRVRRPRHRATDRDTA